MRLFTWEPDWEEPGHLKLAWDTKVQESLTTRECRFAQAPRARVTVKSHYRVFDADELQALKLWLIQSRDEHVVFPVWPRQAEVVAVDSPTQVRVNRSSMFAGRRAIFWRDWRYAEASRVLTAESGVLTLETALTLGWQAGDLVVVGIAGTVVESPEAAQATDELFDGDITFAESYDV